MTPCEERGWKVGDRFTAIPGSVFSTGSVIELYRDDGSSCPLFKLISGDCRYNNAHGPGAYELLEYVQPHGVFTMTNRTELKRQLADTRAQMERLEAELERTEEWEPEGGDWIVTLTGELKNLPSDWKEQVAFGARHPTREQAERARDLMRRHNRALAYVQEHAPDYVFDRHDAFAVELDEIGGWEIAEATWNPIGTVIGPKRVMEQLADDLNSGRVKL